MDEFILQQYRSEFCDMRIYPSLPHLLYQEFIFEPPGIYQMCGQ